MACSVLIILLWHPLVAPLCHWQELHTALVAALYIGLALCLMPPAILPGLKLICCNKHIMISHWSNCFQKFEVMTCLRAYWLVGVTHHSGINEVNFKEGKKRVIWYTLIGRMSVSV